MNVCTTLTWSLTMRSRGETSVLTPSPQGSSVKQVLELVGVYSLVPFLTRTRSLSPRYMKDKDTHGPVASRWFPSSLQPAKKTNWLPLIFPSNIACAEGRLLDEIAVIATVAGLHLLSRTVLPS